MRLILWLILSSCLNAATITVCASGCDYSNLQTAMDAAVRGDIIQLTAGETFEGYYSLPVKTGAGVVTVRSSRYAELPPPGTRITVANAPLMAKLQPSGTGSPVLSAVWSQQTVQSVDTTTDVFTFSSPPGFSNGDPIACRSNTSGPMPIVLNQVYYVINASGSTLQLANLPGGSPIDITTSWTTDDGRCTMAKDRGGWLFQGIEFSGKVGSPTQYNLIEIGNGEENARTGIASSIIFDRVYIHGIEFENGPRNCVVLNSNLAMIVDSRIEFCQREGEESKAIVGWLTPGPVLIRNNYISSASINILWGGAAVTIVGLVNGDNGGIFIEGNHFIKPFSYKYNAGTGGSSDPVGACSDGARYLNTTSGAWFWCSGVSWVAGPTCATGEYYRRTDVTQNCGSGACWSCSAGAFTTSSVYRSGNYNVKNLFECKSCINVFMNGNVFENNWPEAQSGVGIWLVSQVSQGNANAWVRGENIRFVNNILRQSTQGLRLASEGSGFGVNNNNVQISNNLLYKIGATDYPSINDSSSRPLSFAGPCDDCDVDHNTVVSGTTGGTGLSFDTAPLSGFRFTNTIGYANLYGILGDLGNPISYYIGTGNFLNSVFVDNDSSQGAPSSVGAYATNGKFITTGTTLFTSSSDFRLQATSPYSAQCSSGCDFTATDSKDLGADIDIVDAATLGSVAGTFNPLAVRVSAGSTGAVVTYLAPTTAVCTLKLYNDAARTVLNADTSTTPEQQDDRSGNITNGRNRQFVLSGLTASTTYWYVVNCSGALSVGQLNTRATGAAVTFTASYPSARTGEYSANADMSSPTAISSSATHIIPVPSASVRYYRPTGGDISVFIAP